MYKETFPGGESPVLIRRSRDPHGWMGNMSAYTVVYEGLAYRTAEALFQCLRLPETEEDLREEIRLETSPMAAKFLAKANSERRCVVPLSPEDLNLMRKVLRLKLAQHPELKQELRKTGERVIIEDCSNRPHGTGLFWGAQNLLDGTWKGLNWLGVLWTEVRHEIREPDLSDIGL